MTHKRERVQAKKVQRRGPKAAAEAEAPLPAAESVPAKKVQKKGPKAAVKAEAPLPESAKDDAPIEGVPAKKLQKKGLQTAAKAEAPAAPGLLLGCTKCRGSWVGCKQCRNPQFNGRRYQR